MQLGMVGLGRMGGEHDGAAARAPGTTCRPTTRASNRDREVARRARAAARPPRAVWMMVPAGDRRPSSRSEHAARPAEPGDTIVDGGNSNFRDYHAPLGEAQRARASTSSTPASRGGVWGLERRLLPDGRRRRRAPSAGSSRSSATLAPEDGYAHVGAARRRPLREDGPQRDRVRAHAGVRRGLRDDGASRSSTSTCSRSPASGATARSSARGCSTCCSRRFERDAGARGDTRLRRGLGRGPLDGAGGGRGGRAGAGDRRRALRPLRLAAGRVFAAKVNSALRKQFGGHAVKSPAVTGRSAAARRRTRSLEGLALAPDAGAVRARRSSAPPAT